MKKWLKKWWFSLFMYSVALLIIAYMIIMWFLNEEEYFFVGGIACSCIIAFLICITIGISNQPNKEKTNESDINEH